MGSKGKFEALFSGFSRLKVGVIGDVMLDTYWWGHVDRISPEAPVPVVLLDRKEYRIGGAGNVALNLASLGAQATMLSVTGADADAETLRGLFTDKAIDTRYLLQAADRITTNKSRIISRNQQMMRLDAETTLDLSVADEARLLEAITTFISQEQPSIIIFEDYNKGVLTDTVIRETIRICKEHNVLTAVDPKRKSFFSYKGVDLFKPNLKEIREALNLLPGAVTEETMRSMHEALHQRLQHRISLITLSEKGIFYQEDGQSGVLPTHQRNIADVSGAGDTVIAVASLVYAATKDLKLSAGMANIAGGLVCEEVGTAAIDARKLQQEATLLLG